jgi:hypothetical protein
MGVGLAYPLSLSPSYHALSIVHIWSVALLVVELVAQADAGGHQRSGWHALRRRSYSTLPPSGLPRLWHWRWTSQPSPKSTNPYFRLTLLITVGLL